MNTLKIGFQSLGFNRNRNFQPAMEGEGLSPHRNPGAAKSSSSNTIMSGFQTPASAFYAAERCMGFPHHPSTSFISQHNFSFSLESVAQDEPICDFTNALNSQICFNQYQKHSEKSCKVPRTQFWVPFRGNQQDQRAYCNTTRAVVANKTRIRWTQDLHDKFVDCVKRLGGSEKATPKTILKLMDTQGLTIFHVKSHLQKYRIAKYMPDSAQGKSEERSTDLTQIDVKNGLHLTEALQLQLDVQRHLHEQLEFQQNLQLRIEKQGRQLQMMIDEQQKTNESLLKNQDFNITCFDPLEASISENSADALTSGSS
ncbi:hypothetical protein V6N13_073087 [Hibiscus sabdariffa]|uniref:HTH myb-type domain-containing protein n=1 Tax=Hibiscus sabdariffa TaxID=183260 RepID=A0ABR2E819_9ROSI